MAYICCFPFGGVLWFCLCLGGVAWGQPEPENPPQESSFPRPVWHADARWQVEKFAGIGARGHLDGPRLEIEDYCIGRPMARVFQPLGAGRYQYSGLDPLSGRVHRVSGGARGTLDGPLSRARFGGWDYVARNHLARSPDGRYLYLIEGYNRHRLRYIDLQQQWVGTLFPRLTQLRGIAVGDDGTLYLVQHPQQLWTISPDHKKLRRGPRLQISCPANAWGYSLAVDQQLDPQGKPLGTYRRLAGTPETPATAPAVAYHSEGTILVAYEQHPRRADQPIAIAVQRWSLADAER